MHSSKHSLSRSNFGAYKVGVELPSQIEITERQRSTIRSISQNTSPMHRNQLFPSFSGASINRRKVYRANIRAPVKITFKQSHEEHNEPVKGYNIFQFPIAADPDPYKDNNYQRDNDYPDVISGYSEPKRVFSNDQGILRRLSPHVREPSTLFNEKFTQRYNHFRKTRTNTIAPQLGNSNNVSDLKKRSSHVQAHPDIGQSFGEIDPATVSSKGFKGTPRKVTLLEKKTREFLQMKKKGMQRETAENSYEYSEKDILKDIEFRRDEEYGGALTERPVQSVFAATALVWSPGKEILSLNTTRDREKLRLLDEEEAKRLIEPTQLTERRGNMFKDKSAPITRERTFSLYDCKPQYQKSYGDRGELTARDHTSSTPQAREQARIGHIKPRVFESIEFTRINQEFKREVAKAENQNKTYIHKLSFLKRQESPLAVFEGKYRHRKEDSAESLSLALKLSPSKNKIPSSPRIQNQVKQGVQENHKNKRNGLNEDIDDFKIEGWESEEGEQ